MSECPYIRISERMSVYPYIRIYAYTHIRTYIRSFVCLTVTKRAAGSTEASRRAEGEIEARLRKLAIYRRLKHRYSWIDVGHRNQPKRTNKENLRQSTKTD